MKRLAALFLACTLLLSVCGNAFASETAEEVPQFDGLSDPALLQYVQDSVYAGLEDGFQSEDYIIENVTAIYYSKEYLEEVAYNSQSNIFFGYTLAELDEQFQGTPYIFTLGESGETAVQPFEDYDDTYEQIIKNVAIGSGVILLCVTVSVVTGALGAEPVSVVFAASAKSALIMAVSSAAISGICTGIVQGIVTGDMDEATKAAALSASESFKWGAISGSLLGGLSEISALRNASAVAETAEDAAVAAETAEDTAVVAETAEDATVAAETAEDTAAAAEMTEDTAAAAETAEDATAVADTADDASNADGTIRRTWQQSEDAAMEKYPGDSQKSYLNGEEVPHGTPGSTRPDIVREVDGHLEAIEVKNYDLKNNCSKLYSELEREVADRVENLPDGSTQRIVLDVSGQGYSAELIESVKATITGRLMNIYPNIPIDII